MPCRFPILFFPALLAFLIVLPFLALAQPGPDTSAMERIGTMGYLDWPGARAVAVGQGTPPAGAPDADQARALARETALFVARSNLMQVLRQVRVDKDTLLGDLLLKDQAAEERFQRMVQRAPVAVEKIVQGTMVRVILSLPLTGEAAREIARLGGAPAPAPEPKTPQEAPETGPTPPAAPRPPAPQAPQAPEPAPGAAPVFTPQVRAQAESATGLVLDARGSGFTPTLKPRLVHGGQVLYPGDGVDHTVGTRQGFVRYYRDLAEAQQSASAGTAPLVVRASAQGGDLAVSDADAEFIRAVLTRENNFLDQCRVVVVF
ncbi:hypothetical protein [Desulfocurvus sp. DL9XJH121]